MKKQLLEQAIKIARRDIGKHPEYSAGFLHWSFIVVDNQIISSGMNNKSTPPEKWGYHSIKRGDAFRPKTHSELQSIFRSRQYIRGAAMVNVRLGKNKESKISMPCTVCRNVLRVVGIKKCWFTTEHDNWGCVAL